MKDDWNSLGKVRPWRELPLAKRIFYGITHSPWNEKSWEFARLARERQIADMEVQHREIEASLEQIKRWAQQRRSAVKQR